MWPCLPIPIRHEVLIVDRQEMRRRLRQGRARLIANFPVGCAFDDDVLRAVDLETTLGFDGFEPGPPHEVADGCRAMTAEITFRQRGERFVASERGGVG